MSENRRTISLAVSLRAYRPLMAAALALVLGSGLVSLATAEPASPPAAVAPTASSPVPTIEAFHAGLLAIMKDAKTLGFQGRIEKLEPLMGRTFDLEFMASKTVGRHWASLSAADQKRWAETFSRFTTANYAGRFTGFSGEQFVTLGVEDAAHDTRLVLTKIVVPGDEDVELNYRVMQKDGGWKVIDVYLNGKVSELALRRSEYASALKRDGFDQLVVSVETKIANLKSKGRSDG
jgi:phospholipid transport system substrate-binding protein